jgi:cytochrome c551/c552
MTRIERILQNLVKLHMPNLPPPTEQQSAKEKIDYMRKTAQQLAKQGILVIVAETPPELMSQQQIIVEDWLNNYVHLYDIVTKAIYPSLSQIKATYAEQREANPSIIILKGESHAILEGFGRYIMPYVGLRHHRPINADEVKEVMTAFLTFIGADEFPHRIYQALHQACFNAVCQIMGAPIKQISLTDYDPNLLEIVSQYGNTQPLQAIKPSTPSDVKRQEPLALEQFDDNQLDDDLSSQHMFSINVPIRPEKTRRPPLPPLPSRDDEDNQKK